MGELKSKPNQLIYVEPNLESSYNNYDTHGIGEEFPLAPNLEDFCIAVDLEVEVRGREVISKQGTSDGKTLLMSWHNNQSGSTVSFMQGTTINFNNSKGESGGYVDSLTTSYTDIFYNDIKDKPTNEMFGISSIDIDYNNYFVPQVTIQFVDIRGVSLFAPEQLAHNTTVNGMSGVATNDIAGSFFKCFFAFPYPKFRLSVKGIYGQPVAYELTCSDFRATFDSSTGNFGAKATFIGYAFSLLNDVTLNVLAVAPLSDYLGSAYWNSKLNSTFTVSDANDKQVPMKTLTELVDVIKKVKEDLGKLSNDNPICVNQVKLSTQLESISKVELLYNNFMDVLTTNAQKRSAIISATNGKLHTSFLFKDNRGVLVLSNNSGDTINSYADSRLHEPLLSAIAEYNNTNGNVLQSHIPSNPVGNVYPILSDNNKGGVRLITTSVDKNNAKAKIITDMLNTDDNFSKQINEVLNYNNNIEGGSRPLNDYILGFIYTDNGLVDKIANIKQKLTDAITKNEKEVASVKNTTLAASIGFVPNVENLTKIIMAHLETLMYMLYKTASSVDSDRTPQSMGVTSGRTDINSKMINVPPFPKMTVESNTNGNKMLVDSWIGKCSGSVPERDLIHGLLNGVTKYQDVISQAINTDKQIDDDGNVIATSMTIPLTPLDMLITNNPFGDKIDFTNISDFIGRIAIRMHQVLGLPCFNEKDWVNNANILGKADGRNFFTLFPNPSDEFIRRLNMQDFTADFMLDIVSNSSKENIQKEKKQNKWAWDGDTTKSFPLSSTSNKHNQIRFLNLYNIQENDKIINRVIPVQSVTFDEMISEMKIKNNLTGNIIPNSLNNYITTSHRLNSTTTIDKNPNIFKVDEDCSKYESFTNQIELDSDNVSNIKKHFKTSYDVNNYNEYYTQLTRGFIIKKYSNTSFTPEKGNRLLLPIKRELNEIKSTNDVDVFDSSYDLFDCTYIRQGNKKIKRDIGFDGLIKDLSQISNYTIPSFNGFIINGEVTNTFASDKACLFGQYGYYLQNSQLVKSLMFLETLNINIVKYIEDLISSDEGIFIAPKVCSLCCGAYLWRYNEMSKNKDGKDVIVKDEIFNFKADYKTSIGGKFIDNKLFSLRADIQSYLVKEFKDWSTSYFATNIQSEFELRDINGKPITPNGIKELANTIKDKKNLEEYLTLNFEANFFKNYISISHTSDAKLSYSVKLYNRESSEAVKNVTEFMMTPATTIKGIKYMFANHSSYSLNVDNGYATQYLTSFLNELRRLYKAPLQEEVINGIAIARDPYANEQIKIALYKYCKLIYDRWVGGTTFEDWTLEKFFNNHFYFIDAYYNKIGNDALINLDDIKDRMINSLAQSEYSLLSFMGDILAKNSFQLMCIQNFKDLSDNNQMKEMFSSVPYNDMKKPGIHPDFVVMYTYEPSHNLNIEDSAYEDDGLVIDSSNDDNWPDVIKGKNMENGYTIPAFGVSYGSQYQSYFSDINVSMESPMVTEQVIKAQYMIAGQNSSNAGENGKGSIYIGQDLFTIYSNNSYTCTITMVGCAWVQPLMYFCLLNIPMFRGAYLIQKVTHHIEPGIMTTTITGVRMCKTATPIMNKWFITKNNNESGSNTASQQKTLENKNKIASIDNDCDYKVFPVTLMGEGGPTYDLQQLKDTTNLDWLTQQGLRRDYNNLYEAIIATVGAEVGNGNKEGELGVKLVVIVMINRLMGFKNNWQKVLTHRQTAVGKSSYAETKGFTNTVKWVEEVLTKGPACVVGMYTEIPTKNEATGAGPVLIRSEGVITNEMSESVKITLPMVQKIAGYCTTNGYFRRVGNPAILESYNKNEKPDNLWWWDAEYFCHHKGHVFTGMSKGAEKEHWVYKPKVTNNDTNKLSDTAQGLFNAIQETVNSTENIKLDLIGKMGRNNNEILITTSFNMSKNGKMASVFDVILNAYYNNFINLFWVVKDANNTMLDNPMAILVTAKDGNLSTLTNRSVAMVDTTYQPIGSFGNFNNFESFSASKSFSPLFYRSLYKKYAPLDTPNAVSVFSTEVKNFNSTDVNNTNRMLTNNKPAPCPAAIVGGNGERIITDETQYTTDSPALDAIGINKTLYEKCLSTSVAKFKELAPNGWDDNFTLIGVRSEMNSDDKTITNKYIDICVIIHGGGKKFLAPFTTVPGLSYLMNTNGKANNSGVSILQEGSYSAHTIGEHKGEYKALTQRKGDLTTFRDNNWDDKYNFINASSGMYGINIHNNGSVDGVNVNDDSAGCQVFKRMKDFYFMMGLATANKKEVYNYTLISESKLG